MSNRRLAALRPVLQTLDPMRRLVSAPMTAEQSEARRKREFDRLRADDPLRRLYKSSRWQRLRHALYSERGGICECGCGTLTVLHEREATTSTPVAVFDHIISAREAPERFFDPTNLRLLAKPCHDRRTARDQGFARRG